MLLVSRFSPGAGGRPEKPGGLRNLARDYCAAQEKRRAWNIRADGKRIPPKNIVPTKENAGPSLSKFPTNSTTRSTFDSELDVDEQSLQMGLSQYATQQALPSDACPLLATTLSNGQNSANLGPSTSLWTAAPSISIKDPLDLIKNRQEKNRERTIVRQTSPGKARSPSRNPAKETPLPTPGSAKDKTKTSAPVQPLEHTFREDDDIHSLSQPGVHLSAPVKQDNHSSEPPAKRRRLGGRIKSREIAINRHQEELLNARSGKCNKLHEKNVLANTASSLAHILPERRTDPSSQCPQGSTSSFHRGCGSSSSATRQ